MRASTTEVLVLVRLIKPLLAGHPPEIQSAVLADLLSLWVAGHHPSLRDMVLREHVKLVEDLVPESDKELFGEAGHPFKDN